jgi:hypothetical protein
MENEGKTRMAAPGAGFSGPGLAQLSSKAILCSNEFSAPIPSAHRGQLTVAAIILLGTGVSRGRVDSTEAREWTPTVGTKMTAVATVLRGAQVQFTTKEGEPALPRCHLDNRGNTVRVNPMAFTVRRRKAGVFSLLILGFIFAVAGGSVSWFFGSDITLTGQRSTDTCVIEATGMTGGKKEVNRFPLSRVKSAEVESKEGTRSGNKKKKTTYQVVLRTDDGTIPFSNVWTSDREAHQKNAAAINRYLASSEESLSVVQSGKMIRLIGYLFLAIGSLMFLSGLWGILKIFLVLGFAVSKGG